MPAEEAGRDQCVVNVKMAVEKWGGRVRFGWKLSEAQGLWVTARFHAVRETAGGLLVDETPHEHLEAGSYGLFALDAHADGRSFKDHAPNIRRSIYQPVILNAGRRPNYVDPVSSAVDGIVNALKTMDALLQPTDEGRYCVDPNLIQGRYKVVQRAYRRLLRLLDERHQR
jgi:hypothetical protein